MGNPSWLKPSGLSVFCSLNVNSAGEYIKKLYKDSFSSRYSMMLRKLRRVTVCVMLLVEVEYVSALLEVSRQNAVEARMCLRWWMVCSYVGIYSVKQSAL
jgi:hypothetical protein